MSRSSNNLCRRPSSSVAEAAVGANRDDIIVYISVVESVEPRCTDRTPLCCCCCVSYVIIIIIILIIVIIVAWTDPECVRWCCSR